MQASNTSRAYGWVARFFHWAIAALILAAIVLGLYAESLTETPTPDLAAIFAAFSWHKTLGVAMLVLVALRLIWTARQAHPRPLHPQRRLETLLAGMVHWGLWIGMVVMPLSGWLRHSSAPGEFARILWPLAQRLPGVPVDAALSGRFAAFHSAGWWVLAGLVVLHVAGALKHALIDRDGTLSRMAGNPDRAPEPPPARPGLLSHILPALAGLAIWGLTAVVAGQGQEETTPAPTVAEAPGAVASGWAVQQGQLAIEVAQGGNPISGQFGTWNAVIDYDPQVQTGHVTVTIDIASLTLGSVSDNAKGPEFLNAAGHPTATFDADIATEGTGHIARGTLTIAGKAVPAALPFDLVVKDDTATAKGRMQVDRRDFGVGSGYPDESTVGFAVGISFDLTAQRR